LRFAFWVLRFCVLRLGRDQPFTVHRLAFGVWRLAFTGAQKKAVYLSGVYVYRASGTARSRRGLEDWKKHASTRKGSDAKAVSIGVRSRLKAAPCST
jgi:hypothetical protein